MVNQELLAFWNFYVKCDKGQKNLIILPISTDTYINKCFKSSKNRMIFSYMETLLAFFVLLLVEGKLH